MMLQEIWFDGNLMDINEDTKITLVIKSNIFTEISKCVGNRTYTIQLPKTAHNLNVIEQAHLPQSNSTIPYSYHTARYVRNGIEIFSDGYAYIVKVAETIEVCIVWGYPALLRSVFANGINLNEITDDGKVAPYVRYNNVDLWSNLTSRRENDGYCYAAIDFLSYTLLTQTGIYETGAAIARMPKMGYLRPCVFLRHILNRLSTLYGIDFTITDVDLDAWLNKIIFPCVDDNNNYQSTNLKMVFNTSEELWEANIDNTLIYPDRVAGLLTLYPWAVGVCDTEVDISYNVTATITCNENHLRDMLARQLIGARVVSNDYSEYKPADTINIYNSNNVLWDSTSATNVTDTWKITYSSTFSDVSCSANNRLTTLILFNDKYVNIDCTLTSGTVIYTPTATSVIYGTNFPLTLNFPDVKVTDFLQWVAAITGTFPVQRANPNLSTLIEFVPYTTLFNNTANAVDWSGKLVRAYNDGAAKEIGYTQDPWAQVNHFKYGNSEETKAFADGSININNVQLDTEQDIVGEIFDAAQPSNNVPMYKTNETDDANRLRGYLFPDQDETDTPLDAESSDPFVLLAQPLSVVGNNTYIEGVFDSSLHWSNILASSRYTQFISSLQNIKILHEVFALTELDLKTFDETKPVYLAQYGHYYAVTEIKTSETGTAEVTLFQLEL